MVQNLAHHPLKLILVILLVTLATVSPSGCAVSADPVVRNKVIVKVDGKELTFHIPPGTTVYQMTQAEGLQIGAIDRVSPPLQTELNDGDIVRIYRVREEFPQTEEPMPFRHRILQTEQLEKGSTRLMQNGQNGLKSVTFRVLYEDDVEVARTVYREEVITQPVEEIIMVGIAQEVSAEPIAGSLAYLSGGNAFLIRNNTAEVRPLVKSARLDGYVFALSPDGSRLLFTQKSTAPVSVEINRLMVLPLGADEAEPVDLGVRNVVHFAGWLPGAEDVILYSTVEPRQSAPGWQANNDLWRIELDEEGQPGDPEPIIAANSGGVYGWWGTSYTMMPDGKEILASQPGQLSMIDLANGEVRKLTDILPYQTGGNWAWTPPVAITPDGATLYLVIHTAGEAETSQEDSPWFDLAAMPSLQPPVISITARTGMFSSPVISPGEVEGSYQVAFLTAIQPEESRESRYRLNIVDQDGSNLRRIFPGEDMPGMDPQTVFWSPAPAESGQYWIACVYQGNIWMVEGESGSAHPITSDGLISRIDWKGPQ